MKTSAPMVLILCLCLGVTLSCSRLATSGPDQSEGPGTTDGPTSVATSIESPTADTPAERSDAPSGSVVMAAREVGPVIGDPATGPYRSDIRGDFGVGEHLFVNTDGNPMAPMLATAWDIATDASRVTITLRQDIPFNASPLTPSMDFGELTAEDVAWMLNRHNALTNPSSTAPDATQLADFFGEAKALSRYALEVPLAQPVFFGLPLSEMKILRAGPAVESKRAFTLLGPEKVPGVAIGTGPFVQREWALGERGAVEALPTHWSRVSNIQTFTVVQAPETASRIAMLKAGLADAAEIDLSKLPGAESSGMVFIPTMQPMDTETVSVIWAGNLWEEFHARTGEPLEPWISPAYAVDYPWIGSPWGDRVAYTDVDNPEGMSDMEQARLVRWALSMALDRDEIVRSVQSGKGTPLYSEYMGPLYPGWDDDRTVTASAVDGILAKHDCSGCPTSAIGSPMNDVAWPWEIPFDQEGAGMLLDSAGYPRNADGIRFEIKLNKHACETGEICLAQNDAVAAAWESIGVRTTLLREDYLPAINARMRLREQFWPVLKNCIVETAHTPLDWPLPPHDTSLTRPGWGCGFEAPFLATMTRKISEEPDPARRSEWHLDVVDWMYYWQLYGGVTQLPKGVVVNPDRISSWSARSSMVPRWHRPEFIELVDSP